MKKSKMPLSHFLHRVGLQPRKIQKIAEKRCSEQMKKPKCCYHISYIGVGCNREEYGELLEKDVLHGKITKIQNGKWKYQEDCRYDNQRPHYLLKNYFHKANHDFYGWFMQNEKTGAWYCTDGNWHTQDEIKHNSAYRKYCFSDEEVIGYLPLQDGDELILTAQWIEHVEKEVQQEEHYYIYYNGNGDDREEYSERVRQKLIRGKVSVTPKKSHEFKESYSFSNLENTALMKSGFSRNGFRFVGWQARKQIDKAWKWYCTDGTWRVAKELDQDPFLQKYCFSDGEEIGYLPMKDGDKLIMSAVWEEIETDEENHMEAPILPE